MDLNDIRAAATVACFVLFAGIVLWAYSRRNLRRFEEAARLPFDGEE
ncbi:cbb3-type cytochrome c oxidase subunit 3 [Variovorax dokdonensis]|uniref:Cbb3-type cytochrome c oxidase subunit 3 n=1 Tax=Variovorax dokdonensis TaxID=344883 RepID=A0ABT7NAV4_9BURK|nr:cbb3-type cytochrome c oxidase subunit 3 [Variovorax dokdonensis]MDM0045064.1 cbb3-type cytochrome c oxidase subunit 3 [Variovorax dokdonensis]